MKIEDSCDFSPRVSEMEFDKKKSCWEDTSRKKSEIKC